MPMQKPLQHYRNRANSQAVTNVVTQQQTQPASQPASQTDRPNKTGGRTECEISPLAYRATGSDEDK